MVPDTHNMDYREIPSARLPFPKTQALDSPCAGCDLIDMRSEGAAIGASPVAAKRAPEDSRRARCNMLLAAAALTLAANPFARHSSFFVSPTFVDNLDSLLNRTIAPGERAKIEHLKGTPTAVWLPSNGAVTDFSFVMEALSAQREPPLVVVVLYNLPNRDCAAGASAGEICCFRRADGTCDLNFADSCERGLRQYRDDFILPFASLLRKYPRVPVTAILEPDSLGNLVTNSDNPSCASAATNSAYKDGIALAVAAIKEASPDTSIYLDAAHGGWLGWDANAKLLAETVCSMNMTLHDVRGFATNIANYNPVGLPCPAAAFEGDENAAHYCHWVAMPGAAPCCSDIVAGPCGAKYLEQYSSGFTEVVYAQTLSKYFREQCDFDPKVIIDTARNGNPATRGETQCSGWCNLREAVAGPQPTLSTTTDVVDAFFWIKTPGESDGCSATLPSGDKCQRYADSCGAEASLGSREAEERCAAPSAPQAGFAQSTRRRVDPCRAMSTGPRRLDFGFHRCCWGFSEAWTSTRQARSCAALQSAPPQRTRHSRRRRTRPLRLLPRPRHPKQRRESRPRLARPYPHPQMRLPALRPQRGPRPLCPQRRPRPSRHSDLAQESSKPRVKTPGRRPACPPRRAPLVQLDVRTRGITSLRRWLSQRSCGPFSSSGTHANTGMAGPSTQSQATNS